MLSQNAHHSLGIHIYWSGSVGIDFAVERARAAELHTNVFPTFILRINHEQNIAMWNKQWIYTTKGTLTRMGDPKQSGSKLSENETSKETSKNYSTMSLYNVEEMTMHLSGLTLATFAPALDHELYSICKSVCSSTGDAPFDQSSLTVSSTMTCSVCSTVFANRNEQIMHYKLDWHRFNIKLKLQGKKPIPEGEFDKVAGDISSLSGSDSSSDDEKSDDDTNGSDSCGNHHRKPSVLPLHVTKLHTRRRRLSSTSTDTETEDNEDVDKSVIPRARLQPKLYFKNHSGKIVALYRCVVHGKENTPQNESDLLSRVAAIPNEMNWAIILVGGGHFAAAVYNKSQIILHKTFHRYTVRAKQGSSQGTRDAKHGGIQPKSAGASLRRYNEAALMKDIQDLLSSWNSDLQKCNCIFYRAPSFNRFILFGGKNPPFKKGDFRLRNIPFPTRRATFNEVQRVFRLLSTLECFGERPDCDRTLPQSPKVHLGVKKEKKYSSASSPEKVTETNKKSCASNVKEKTKKLMKDKQEDPAISEKNKDVSENCAASCTSGSDDSVKFEVTDETTSTKDLKEMDSTYRPKHHKRKLKQRSNSLRKRQQDPSKGILSDENCNMKNALFLACRNGDLESLEKLLSILKNKPDLATPDHNIQIAEIEDSGQTSEVKLIEILSKIDNSAVTETDSVSVKQSSENIAETEHIENITSDPNNMEHCKKLKSDYQSLAKKRNFVLQIELEYTVPDSESSYAKFYEKCNKNLGGNQDTNNDNFTLKILNDSISDSGATMLHVATKGGHHKAVRMLLEHGADPTTRDKQGFTPYMVSSNREMRNVYRHFMAENPDRFNYNKAQIPSPLTEELLREQKERKKEKKKLKKEKLKVKKAIEEQTKLEEEEKKRFLSLSDREKRALAAEKRYVSQLSATGESAPVLSRCFQCGENITGKVPFEYNNNCFCTVNCVKAHRKGNSPIS